jgi:hypothetical protein
LLERIIDGFLPASCRRFRDARAHGRSQEESWLRGQKGAPAHHELFGIAAQTKAITNLAT